jgi:hypothetical protein
MACMMKVGEPGWRFILTTISDMNNELLGYAARNPTYESILREYTLRG